MNFIFDKLMTMMKELMISSIMANLTGLFDNVNARVADIAVQVGQTPQGWNGGIYSMIKNLSDQVALPIAGIILTIVATAEFMQMVINQNNRDFETWIFFKWTIKTFFAVMIVSHTWNIVMAIFDVAQHVVNNASGIIIGDTNIDINSVIASLETQMETMELGPIFSLWLQSELVGITMWVLTICIFLITYGRMIEIYLVTSLAPIPLATMANQEWGQMGKNYIRSLAALGFQAFLIVVCVAIYAVLIQHIGTQADVMKAIWTCMGYTVLLCFTLFKTGSLAQSIFNAR